jgi:hypothetical protein
VAFRPGDEVEKGFVHPRAMRFSAEKLLSEHFGVFFFAQVGKSDSELSGGLLIHCFGCDPDAGESCAESWQLRLSAGIGMGAAGIPIVSERVEARAFAFVAATGGSYHYLTGLSQFAEVRGRIWPHDPWWVEVWVGARGSVSGKPGNLFDSLEAGVPLTIAFRWPVNGALWAMWPWRTHERRISVNEIDMGLELDF